MAFVETRLGGRSYRIDCADAQYERLSRLTRIVETRAAALDQSGAAESAHAGEDPEPRFLLLTALLVADLLVKAEDELDAVRTERNTIEQSPTAAPAVEEARIVSSEGEEAVAEPAHQAEAGASEAELDPEIEAVLADLFETAAERMHAAADALEAL